MDGCFSPAKTGSTVGKTNRGKIAKRRVLDDGQGLPLGVIDDRGDNSGPLGRQLKQRGIELISPYRSDNKERRCEDKHKLGRYVRGRIVKPSNAWLGNFHLLLVPHEHLLSAYCAFSSTLLLDHVEALLLKPALAISPRS